MTANLLDPHWALLPEYRIEGVLHDDGKFSVTRADDKLVLSQQFLDELAVGHTRTDATLDVRPCECGRRCYHGAVLTVDALTYRLTEQIEDRTVWWAERFTEAAAQPLSLSRGRHHADTIVVEDDVDWEFA